MFYDSNMADHNQTRHLKRHYTLYRNARRKLQVLHVLHYDTTNKKKFTVDYFFTTVQILTTLITYPKSFQNFLIYFKTIYIKLLHFLNHKTFTENFFYNIMNKNCEEKYFFLFLPLSLQCKIVKIAHDKMKNMKMQYYEYNCQATRTRHTTTADDATLN